jgi:hypothetical protein
MAQLGLTIALRITPAMQAGLATTIWTMGDLLATQI